MINRVHNGKSYTEIESLPAVDQLKLQGAGIDKTKITAIHTCCYVFRDHIDTHYYQELQILWKTQ